MAFSNDAPIHLIQNKKKRSKYRNEKTVVGDLKFDSKKEANRWQNLLLLQKCGLIKKLKRQVPVRIKIKGQKICTWWADFVYEQDGKTIHEDVKSEITRKHAVYRLKKKLVKACHGIEIQET